MVPIPGNHEHIAGSGGTHGPFGEQFTGEDPCDGRLHGRYEGKPDGIGVEDPVAELRRKGQPWPVRGTDVCRDRACDRAETLFHDGPPK
ncbi:hypothetical protein GCM10010299_54230 [Streptomyces tanashiensis]|nr:hypothetical protein GCM10010299_54230 [Streptomyces tanashiensis]